MADPEELPTGAAAPAPTPADVEAQARDAQQRAVVPTGRARRAAVVGLRVATGVVGIGAGLAVIAAVGLLPLPRVAIAAPSTTVTPTPADQLRVCPGTLLRLGDEQGQNAGTASSLGAPQRRSGAEGAEVRSHELARTDADTGGTSSAPTTLRIPGGSGLLAGAQSQVASTDDIRGLAATGCAEPSGSIWLVGGSTATGRTTLLTLANPTEVDATISLTILGEKGPVSAPGTTGIAVAAGTQRVLSLAGFAPDLVSPVVHVVARGGRVVAALQQSTVRGLDAGGVDLVGAAADPAASLVIPGVRVLGADAVAEAAGLEDWNDVAPSIRIGNPGSRTAKVRVQLVPEAADAHGTSFEIDVAAGQVREVGLDSGADTDTGALTVPDGEYSVRLDSDAPIVAGARVSTAAAAGTDATAPASDFAWDVAAPPLDGRTLVTIAPGPDPRVAVAGARAGTVTLRGVGGAADIRIAVPAGGQASAPVVAGASYEIQDGDGFAVAIGYAGSAQLASYTVISPRPVSGPIVIRP